MSVSAPVATRDPAGSPAGQHVPIWRNLQFQTLWAGQVASSLGIGVADVAYPLA